MNQTSPDYRSLITKALLEIKDLKARLRRQDEERMEPIAVVGMACRFPGNANNTEQYWNMLRDGVDAISSVTADRWDINRFHDHDSDMPVKISTTKGGFLHDIKGFDASFFGISPRECESLDPHQRMILEVSWEALEHANLLPENLFGSNSGVFIGVSSMDNVIRLMGEASLSEVDAYYGTGCALSPIAGRVSYNLGFTGPSFIVDTACSSSLLSLHLATESLRRNECDLALGGGVHLLFHPGISVAFSQAQMLSPDGRCKTFDAAANGYTRGEGCGMVVLKRLSDAQRDGNSIFALIRGSAVNQDGASGGLAIPSGPSQEQVIQKALARAGIKPEQVNYVEAHGTGIPLGDPIEISALVNALGKGRTQPLMVGSVKTNIGHLEASAGIASVIKVVLALQHGAIPPHLHFNEPNPLIPWSEIPINIPSSLTPWPPFNNSEAADETNETDKAKATAKAKATDNTKAADKTKVADGIKTIKGAETVNPTERIAGISSFGFSGTNVHMLISGAESVGTHKPVADTHTSVNLQHVAPELKLFPLSARTDDALRDLAQRYLESPFFSQLKTRNQNSAILSKICAGAASMRTHFVRRLALVADNMDSVHELLTSFTQTRCNGSEESGLDCTSDESGVDCVSEELRRYGNGDTAENMHIGGSGDQPRVAFLFTGQGSQYPGMGQELYATEPIFREAVKECDAILSPVINLSLPALLYGEKPASAEQLAQTALTQPLLFSLEYALARLWMSWGVTPEALMGHSVGEYVAACVAGVFSLEDGLKLIAARARLMYELPRGGSMAAVFADPDFVEKSIRSIEGSTISGKNQNGSMQGMNTIGTQDAVTLAVAVAAYNGPRNTVISGSKELVESILVQFESQGIECRRLPVSHAFHSHLMEPVLTEFKAVAQKIRYNEPRIPVISNITGTIAGSELSTPEYWVRHVMSPIRFSDGIEELFNKNYDLFIEIGPSATLIGMARQVEGAKRARWLPSLRRNSAQHRTMLNSLGEYWVEGGTVDWESVNGIPDRNIQLPTYPFQHHRQYWKEIPVDTARGVLHGVTHLTHPLLMCRLSSPILREKLFESLFSTAKMPFLEDHRVFGKLVVAGATHLSLVLGAAALDMGCQCRLEDVLFPQALVIPDEGEIIVQLAIEHADNQGISEFRLISLDQEGKQAALHARGKIAPLDTESAELANTKDTDSLALPENTDLSALPEYTDSPAASKNTESVYSKYEKEIMEAWSRCTGKIPVEQVYALQEQRHIVPGSSYRWLNTLHRGNDEVIARLTPPSLPQGTIERYELHPGLIDSCFGAMVMAKSMDIDETFIPFGVAELHLFRAPGVSSLTAHAIVRHHDRNRLVGDIHLYTEENIPVATFIGLEGRRAGRNALLQESVKPSETLYQITWETASQLPNSEVAFKPTISEISEAEIQPDTSVSTASWLLFSDKSGVAEALQNKLVSAGVRVIVVYSEPGTPGLIERKGSTGDVNTDEFTMNIRNKEYALSPDNPEAFDDLLTACGNIDGVIFLWGLTPDSDFMATYPPGTNSSGTGSSGINSSETDSFQTELTDYERHACGGAFHLLKALTMTTGKKVTGGNTTLSTHRLLIVTRGAQSVLNDDRVPEPCQAMLWGLGLVSVQELPELGAVCVDLEPDTTDNQAASGLMATLTGKIKEERLAWRNGLAYVARLKAISPEIIVSPETAPLTTSLPKSSRIQDASGIKTNLSEKTLVRDDCTYLISGGLGELGTLLTEWLVTKGARNIALLGRSAPNKKTKQLLQALRSKSARIELYRTDVSDPEALASTLTEIADDMPALGGIFHLAGRVDDGTISTQSFERVQQVLLPKVNGAWNLHHLTGTCNLDHFVCFSSVASLLGSAGQAGYSAANAFLDALAQHRKAKGLCALSINWGPWADVGMAARLDKQKSEQLAQRGIFSIGTREGMDILGKLMAFEQNMSLPSPQIGVVAAQWNIYSQNNSTPFLELLLINETSTSGLQSPPADVGLIEQLQLATPAEQRILLTIHLKELVAGVLKLNQEDIGLRERLFDLGIDSLMAVELKNRLQKNLKIVLSSTLLFDYPTVETLLGYLLDEALAGKLQNPISEQDEKIPPRKAHPPVDELSEEEAEELLLAELKKLETLS